MTSPTNRATPAIAVLAALMMALGVATTAAAAEGDRADSPLPSTTSSSADRSTTASSIFDERPAWTNTPCPAMTDSITRLYTAYFGRQPEQGGFEFWTNAYASGEWNLDRMSIQFSVSDEFVQTYGSLTNAEFVDLIYLNIQGRPADEVGRVFWTNELDSGRMTRGRVMIFFSESEEYVTRSQTVRPMAGYLGWYPEGTTWGCAGGPGAFELSPGNSNVDILIENFEATPQRYTITSYNRSFAEPILLNDATLTNGFYDYYKNGTFLSGDGYLEFDMTRNVYWTVVEYPTPMVEARPGWDD